MSPVGMPPFYSPWAGFYGVPSQHPWDVGRGERGRGNRMPRGRGMGRGRGRGRGNEFASFPYAPGYPPLTTMPYDPYGYSAYLSSPVATSTESTIEGNYAAYAPTVDYLSAGYPSSYKATTQRESPRYNPY